MLARPISDDPHLAKIWKLRQKFNKVLDDIMEIEQFMYVMPIRNMEESKYFDDQGHLTKAGKNQFWLSLNDQFKAFEYASQESSKSLTKLPTPPPNAI